MTKADYGEIISEYKEQVRVLKEQNNELTDACKAKDAALKRALQKLEYTTVDLNKLEEQKKKGDSLKTFESSGNDILTGGANMERFGL